MKIDLNPLKTNLQQEINITGEYNLDSTYYENSDILSLEPVEVDGKIIQKESVDNTWNYYLKAKIKGKMILLDSISLEEIKYPFKIEYDDFLEENIYLKQNILDIFEFLWENILLEVPLHYTKVEDLHKFHGDGWKLIHEDEVENHNPFHDLLKDIEKE